MAHPLFIMEQAMRQFSSQWCSGLRPSLEIKTTYNGSLVVNSKVFCSNMSSPCDWRDKSSTPQFPFSSTPRSKRAKKNARYRRNNALNKVQKPITTEDVETQCSNEKEGALNTKAIKADSGFKETTYETSTAIFHLNLPYRSKLLVWTSNY